MYDRVAVWYLSVPGDDGAVPAQAGEGLYSCHFRTSSERTAAMADIYG